MTIGKGRRLRSLGLPGADLSRVTGLTATMVDFLTSHTGAELPSLEYTQVFVPGDAAQEAAGFALLSASSIDDVKRDETEDWIFSHELAHQWFAWVIPCADFSDFWLNEGFATFFVAAMKEQRHGRAAYDREVALWRKRSAKVHAEGKDAPVSLSDPSSPPHPGPTEAQLQPRGVTYSRGALVLDRLRTELGDAVFWNGVRGYVRDRAGRDARTEDLRRAMETASGKDLKPFFDTWVYRPAPTLLTLLRQNRRETWPEAKRSSEEIAVRRAER
jgi:aminopeptidase N